MSDLNSIMEFDHVVRVTPDGAVTDGPDGVYAPELSMNCDDEGQVSAEDERDYIAQAERQGWQLLSGWTGQYGYHGVCMHASEYVGGALEDYILETPGLYVLLVVQTPDEEEPAGWAIAYQEAHADYPHEPGRLYECEACEASCHCIPGYTQCVYTGEHNGSADEGTEHFPTKE